MIAIIGDPHIRDGDDIISKFRLFSFERALSMAAKKGATDIIITGDLFDKQIVSPLLIRKVNSIIYSNTGIRVWIIAGNHDTKMGIGSAVWYVEDGTHIKSVDSISVASILGKRILFIPYKPQSSAEDSISLTDGKVEAIDLIVGHFGVYGSDDPGWMKHDRWFVSDLFLSNYMTRNKISRCVFGHKHIASIYGDGVYANRSIIGIGSLIPCSSSESGVDFGNIVFPFESEVFADSVVPGVRYVEDASYIKDCCVVHVKEQDGSSYYDMSDDSKPEDLIGKCILMDRGLNQSKDKPVIDIDDPICKESIQNAVMKYIDSVPFDSSDIGGLRDEAMMLLYGHGVVIKETLVYSDVACSICDKKGGDTIIYDARYPHIENTSFYWVERLRK